jgi:uncharacterized protein (TIGR02996 family)
MPHRPFIILVALFFAIGLPLIYVLRKKRAASSLEGLLAERFQKRLCPVRSEIAVPSGGRVQFNEAYNDRLGGSFVLILGNWARGTIMSGGAAVPIYNKVAGLYREGADVTWLESIRSHGGVIGATPADGGCIVIWEGLPSRESVLAHIQEASAVAPKAPTGAVASGVQVPQPPPPAKPVADTASTVAKPPAVQPESASQPKPPTAINPRDAYFLGYLPSVVGKTVVNYSLIDEVEAQATNDTLKHACEFGRKANKVNEVEMRSSYDSLVKYGNALGFAVPPIPRGTEYKSWVQEVLHAGRIAAGSEGGAFEAGTAAGDVHFAMWIARNLIYLRTSAPGNQILIKRVEETSIKLEEAAAWLSTVLDRFGKRSPAESNEIRKLLGKRPNLPTLVSTGGMQVHFSWANELEKHFRALGQSLDRPVEAPMAGPPTEGEEKLLQEVIAHPEDDAPRVSFAKLAARRNDPRAELIQTQIAIREMRRCSPMGMPEIRLTKRAAQLVHSHPEWSDAVLRLGPQSASFRRGFVDEITIDASRFLKAAPELYKIAPILHVHFTGAKGKVSEIVASPHIARVRSIDLRENGITDDEVETLATAPNLAKLRWLSLTLNKITVRGVEALARSSSLDSLVYVELGLNLCDDPTPRFVETEGMGSYWESTPAGIALEKKVGRKVEWLHQDFSRWPADVEMV